MARAFTNAVERLDQVLRCTLDTLVENNDGLLNDILTRVVIDTLDKYQQKLNVGVSDSIGDLLEQFRKRIEIDIFDVGQKWSASNQLRDDKAILPRNCRFFCSKGRSTIVVIENDSCRRTLALASGLAGYTHGLVQRHNLLLPYTLFVFHFKKEVAHDRLSAVYTAWRPQSLTNLMDRVYDPLLPNIHKNYMVCLGDMNTTGRAISEICETTLSSYWQSTFNTDLADFWWSKRNHVPIKDVETWERNSDNPFLFNSISLTHSGKTVESMIDFCLQNEEDPDGSKLRHRLVECIEGCSTELFTRMMKYFKRVKFDKLYPKDIRENLKSSVSDITKEISDIASQMQIELQSLGEPTANKSNHSWVPKGSAWHSYEAR